MDAALSGAAVRSTVVTANAVINASVGNAPQANYRHRAVPPIADTAVAAAARLVTGGVDEMLAQRWGDDGDALVAAALAAKEAAMDRAAADLAARKQAAIDAVDAALAMSGHGPVPQSASAEGDPTDVARDKTTNNVDASSVVTIDVVTPEIVSVLPLGG
jgi:hypothetical protein